MLRRTLLATTLALVALAAAPAAPAAPAAQGVGSAFPDLRLENFQQTDATSLDDFYGRALLIEFFAHW